MLDEYLKSQEEAIQRKDNSIRIFWNPRIERHLVCQDLRIVRKNGDPWVDRDPDLEGVEGVGERTPFSCLFRCETKDGHPFPPLAPLILKVLTYECPAKHARDPAKVAWEGVHVREAAQAKVRKEAVARAKENLLFRLTPRVRMG